MMIIHFLSDSGLEKMISYTRHRDAQHWRIHFMCVSCRECVVEALREYDTCGGGGGACTALLVSHRADSSS